MTDTYRPFGGLGLNIVNPTPSMITLQELKMSPPEDSTFYCAEVARLEKKIDEELAEREASGGPMPIIIHAD